MHYLENEFAEFRIDGKILFFVYKADVVIGLQAAKKIVADRLKIQDGKIYPVFCDVREIKEFDKAARDYLAKEGSVLVKAVGILANPPVTRAMSDFYLQMNRPLIPTQIFTEEDAALQYLNSYIS